MALYAYKGLGADGKTVQGVLDAESPKALRQALRRDGILVTQSSVAKGGKKPSTGSGLSRELHLGDVLTRIKRAEVATFTRQLSTLLRAGIPLAECLGALYEQTENVKFKAKVGQVRAQVNEGGSLASSLGRHPQIFDSLYCSMVNAGEVAGNLEDVLTRLADFMESGEQLKSKVQSAMIYPIIMAVVGVGIMAVLMIAVIPKITAMFAQEDQALPWNTELLIWISGILGSYWWLIAIVTTVGVIALRRWARSDVGRPVWDRFVLRLPLIGPLAKQVALARFTRTLGTMLHAGVPMLSSLDTAKEILGNAVLMGVIENAKVAVSEGASLAVTLKKSGYVPATLTHMIAVGERAGLLESMLMRVADAYEREVTMKLDRLTTMLEPLMLVAMGLSVGFVVFSILMPIMDMSSLTR